MSEPGIATAVAITLFVLFATIFAFFLVLLGRIVNPTRPNPVKSMPYESGMDPIHGARRRLDVRFHLVAIAFLIFDVELLFLYPWAVLLGQVRSAPAAQAMSAAALETGGAVDQAFAGRAVPETQAQTTSAGAVLGTVRRTLPPFAFEAGILFTVLLVLGYVYDWRKGVFAWR